MSEPAQPRSTAPVSTREDALAVLRTLRDAGHIAYFAGGCVRDLLLGKTPKDWDVATDAVPDRVRSLFRNTQAVGAAFGVILVRHGKSVIEVATFRTESSYTDGRRPESVRFTTAEEDAQRRDFTINGLFLDPLTGQVIDYVNGQADLQAMRIRAIGKPDERFAEDHLRLLRAVRFAARLSFEIEPATAAAIKAHANQLKRISPERVAEELRLMLTPATRNAAWALLWRLDLAQVLFRFLPPRASPNGMRFDLFAALAGDSVSFGLALLAASMVYLGPADEQDLLEVLDEPVVQAIGRSARQALKVSNDELDAIRLIPGSIRGLLQPDPPTIAQLKRFLAMPHASDARQLLLAIRSVGWFSGRVDWLEQELNRLEQTDFAPPPLVTGDDLTAAGLRPGPMFKRILDAVYDAQLESRVTDKEQALQLAMQIASQSRK